MGVAVEPLDAGCCGMAGSFGFEADKYDVSVAVGERRLLPAIRQAPASALIVADGFSCREQIRQTRRSNQLASAYSPNPPPAARLAARPGRRFSRRNPALASTPGALSDTSQAMRPKCPLTAFRFAS